MRSFVLLIFSLLSTAAFAQSPAEEWRTVETEHFRVHYPAPFEEWTLEVASRLESTRERVAERIGFRPADKVDIIVADPAATANGSAWPLLGWPRIVLWTTPPEPESSVGSFRDWRELLVTHEQAHILHLARPPRNPLQRILVEVLPLSPISNAPRWLSEGYATVIEGELTGSGRPYSAMRASVLRTWGRNGRLPSYERLASDRSSWMGMSMAYLVGSAFLEWLQLRSGDDALRDLWARMTARERRSFDAAFRGVFGDSPRVLYARFAAEVTAAALAEERASSPRHEGELWQDFNWGTDPPAVSRDGALLVTVRRSRKLPARLVIYSTAAPKEEEERFEKRMRRTLERDPEDVLPVLTTPIPRKPRFTLTALTGADPRDPRFAPDGKSVVFHQLEPDDEGVMHSDLFRWHFENDEIERITEEADLREADPSPDGKSIVAVRHRFGKSAVVQLDVSTGAIALLTDESVSTIYARPRWSSDGRQLAVIAHEGARWQPLIIDAATRRQRKIDTAGDVVSALSWSPDGLELFTTIAEAGHFDIAGIDVRSGAIRRLTNGLDPFFAPEVTPNGETIYFLALDVDGTDIRTTTTAPTVALVRLPVSDPLISPPRPGEVAPPPSAPLPPSSPYGLGRQEVLPLISGTLARSSQHLELGIRIGDVVGRIDTLLIGSIGRDEDLRGAALATALRIFPVEVSAHLFTAEQENSKADFADGEAPGAALLDLQRTGLEIRGTKRFAARAKRMEISSGATYVDSPGDRTDRGDGGEIFAFLDASFRWRTRVRNSRIEFESNDAVVASGDRTLLRLGGDLAVTIGGFTFGLEGLRLLGGDGLVSLGGSDASIIPRSLQHDRVIDPAYAPGARFGDEATRLGVTMRLPNGVRLFARTADFSGANCCNDDAKSWGAELRAEIQPFPLLRLPAMSFDAGLARVDVGTPSEHTSYWLSTTVRP